MYVLDKLWRGKLSPNEQCVNYGSEYSTLSSSLLHISKQIMSVLPEAEKQLFQEYQETQQKMIAISEEDVFVNGFRIGMGLILDAIGTYESQFVRYHEE